MCESNGHVTGEKCSSALAQPGFLEQFTVHRLLRGLVTLDTTLWKLPGVLAGAARPENLTFLVAENDTHIRSESIRINHVGIIFFL